MLFITVLLLQCAATGGNLWETPPPVISQEEPEEEVVEITVEDPHFCFTAYDSCSEAEADTTNRRVPDTNPYQSEPIWADPDLTCAVCALTSADRNAHVAHIETHGRRGQLRRRDGQFMLPPGDDDRETDAERYRRHFLFLAETYPERSIQSAQEARMIVGAASRELAASARGACACCARQLWVEELLDVTLAPALDGTSLPPGSARCFKAPSKAFALLDVDTYHQRWPNIPLPELMRSAVPIKVSTGVIHALLHRKRVVNGNLITNEFTGQTYLRPGSTCRFCQSCWDALSGKSPSMPKFALANDNFIGRIYGPLSPVRRKPLSLRSCLQLARPVVSEVFCVAGQQRRAPKHAACPEKQRSLISNVACFHQKRPDVVTGAILPPNDIPLHITISGPISGPIDGQEAAAKLRDLGKDREFIVSRNEFVEAYQFINKYCPHDSLYKSATLKADQELARCFPNGTISPLLAKRMVFIPSELEPETEATEASVAMHGAEAAQHGETEEDAGGWTVSAVQGSEELDVEKAMRVAQETLRQRKQLAKAKHEKEKAYEKATGGDQATDDEMAAQIATADDTFRQALKEASSAQARIELQQAMAGTKAKRPPPGLTDTTRIRRAGEMMDMFSPEIWHLMAPDLHPFGDGVWGLDRVTPLSFEEWCLLLFTREELEYGTVDDAANPSSELTVDEATRLITHLTVDDAANSSSGDSPAPYRVSETLCPWPDTLDGSAPLGGSNGSAPLGGGNGSDAPQWPSRWRQDPQLLHIVYCLRRRIKIIQSARMFIDRKGFQNDVSDLLRLTPEQLSEALAIVGKDGGVREVLQSAGVPAGVKKVLKSVEVAFAAVPGTNPHRTQLRHEHVGYSILFGPPLVFTTANFPDTRAPLLRMIFEGKDILVLRGSSSCTLRRFHQMLALDPTGQAIYFDKMMKTFMHHVLGIDPHCTPETDGSPSSCAASGKPGIFGHVKAFMAPLESQARPSLHGHASVWLMNTLSSTWAHNFIRDTPKRELRERLRSFNRACLMIMESMQTESTRAYFGDVTTPNLHSECAAEATCASSREELFGPGPLSRNRPSANALEPLPWTKTMRRQTKWDGEVDEDKETIRPNVPVVNEDENRPLLFDDDVMPHHLAQMPAYRLPTAADLPFEWWNHFARDARACVMYSHLHTCKSTCYKYVQAGAPRVCRFNFVHFVKLRLPDLKGELKEYTFARKGKQLERWTRIHDGTEWGRHRNEDGGNGLRGKPIWQRDHGFEGSTNLIAQVVLRGNVDVQTLHRVVCDLQDIPDTDSESDMSSACEFSEPRASTATSQLLSAVLEVCSDCHAAGHYSNDYATKASQSFAPLLDKLATGLLHLQEDVAALDLDEKDLARKTLIRLQTSSHHCMHKTGVEMAFAILFDHECYKTHKCWNLLAKHLNYRVSQAHKKKWAKGTEDQAEYSERAAIVDVAVESDSESDCGEESVRMGAVVENQLNDWLYRGRHPLLCHMGLYHYAMHARRATQGGKMKNDDAEL